MGCIKGWVWSSFYLSRVFSCIFILFVYRYREMLCVDRKRNVVYCICSNKILLLYIWKRNYCL